MFEEKLLLGPVFFVSSDRLNMDRLSHVVSSDELVSLDGPKAQLVTLGHSPHSLVSKKTFLSLVFVGISIIIIIFKIFHNLN